MNQKNFSALLDFLRFRGFGEPFDFILELEKLVAQDLPAFHLPTEASFDDSTKMEAILYFRKSIQEDGYFLIKYIANLHHLDEPDRDRSQTFYTYDDAGITFMEVYNLLNGRSVYKNLVTSFGEKYNGWLQLNFKEKDGPDNYRLHKYKDLHGFDLEKVLELYPIREMREREGRESLIRSLKKGNLHPAHFVKPKKTELKFIGANARNKTINIYSTGMTKSKKVS
ncbi:MAG TPA: hypothetical protein VF974_01690 [Patescibacteria group bacterium]